MQQQKSILSPVEKGFKFILNIVLDSKKKVPSHKLTQDANSLERKLFSIYSNRERFTSLVSPLTVCFFVSFSFFIQTTNWEYTRVVVKD